MWLPENVPEADCVASCLELIENVGNIIQSAIDGLEDRRAGVGIPHALLQFGNIGRKPLAPASLPRRRRRN